MKKAKKLTALFLAVAMTVSLAACSDSTSSSETSSKEASTADVSSGASSDSNVQTITDGTLTLSTNAEFEPFEYKDSDKIVGIDIEIAEKIAKKLGLELKINDVSFDSLTMELTTNKCDFVAAGMTADAARAKNVDFSDYYYDASQAIIVAKGSEIKTPSDLNGKTVGVQQGTTGDTYCTNEEGKSDVQVKEVKRYNKGADGILDLISGRIDAVVIDDFPATKFVEKNPDKIQKLDNALTSEQYAIGVKKGNKALLDVINSVLKDLKSSGELDQIVEKYEQN
ncbi:MAG: transporter substrate-binding domain-containing protein [Oscillospiraceae bacterium]|jgi:polar amino acid transport system substrate-binding protein|nr:transporter substrate-binding domain-containing protein [Oscillospiraceae bacterium]